MATMTRIPVCWKKKRERERKEKRKNWGSKKKEKRKVKIWSILRRGLKKKKKKKNQVVDRRIYPVRGRGNGCPRLKFQENNNNNNNKCPAPMDVCDLKIRIDRYVCIKFQRRGTQFGLRLECVLFKDWRPSCLTNHESTWHRGSPYMRWRTIVGTGGA